MHRMERKRETSQPDNQAEGFSASQQSKRKNVDFATDHNVTVKAKGYSTKPKNSKDHSSNAALEDKYEEAINDINKRKESHFECKKYKNELMDLYDMPKILMEKTKNYERAGSEFIDLYDMTWFILEQAENYERASHECKNVKREHGRVKFEYENHKIGTYEYKIAANKSAIGAYKHEYKYKKYNDAKSKYEQALWEFKNTTLGQNILPHEEDLSAEELTQRLGQALDEAWIRLSNARANDKLVVITHMKNRLQKHIKNLEKSIPHQDEEIKTLREEIDKNTKKIAMQIKSSTELEEEACHKEKEYHMLKYDSSKKHQDLKKKKKNDLLRAESEWETASKNAQEERDALQRAFKECFEKVFHLEDAKREKKHLEEKYNETRSRLRDLQEYMQNSGENLLKKAQTELLEARIDTSDAVITRAIPDDEDKARMREAKEEAMQSREWRPPRTKQFWEEILLSEPEHFSISKTEQYFGDTDHTNPSESENPPEKFFETTKQNGARTDAKIREQWQNKIKHSEADLSHLNESIENLNHEINNTQQEIEKFEKLRYLSQLYADGYKAFHHDIEEEYHSIKTKLLQLEEEHTASSEDCESLEVKINDLNNKIAAKEEQKKLILLLEETIKQHDEAQKDYNSLPEETKTLVDLQSKDLNDLQEEIKCTLLHQETLQKELDQYNKKLSNKRNEKQTFDIKLSEINALNDYADKERNLAEIQKKIKKVEQTISDKIEWIKYLEETQITVNRKLEVNRNNIRTQLDYMRWERMNINKIEDDTNILNDNSSSPSEKIEITEKIMEKAETDKITLEIPQFHSDVLEEKQKYSKEEKENLLSDYKNCEKKLNAYYDTAQHEVLVSEKVIQSCESIIKNIDQEIKNANNDVKILKKEKSNYNNILNEENLLMQDHTKNKTSNYNLRIDKKDEITPLRTQLAVIKEYAKSSIIKKIKDSSASLQSQNSKLHAHKNEIENVAASNREIEKEIQTLRFAHDIYLEERKHTLWLIKDESFKPIEYGDLYKDTNCQNSILVNKACNKIKKAINQLINQRETLDSKVNGLITSINKLNVEIHNLIQNITIDQPKQEKIDLLNKFLDRRSANVDYMFDSMKEGLVFFDGVEKQNLSHLSIKEKLYDYQLKKIEDYQSELKSFHTEKSKLQTEIDNELTKIRSQFDIDLQNLQKSHDEKKSELESLTSKLTALEKGMKWQELQKNLDKLVSQVNTNHPEIETITQELEESRKALADAEQEKRKLETKLEHPKKALEKKEEQLKHAEYEYKKGENAFKKACSSLEEAKIQKNQQESALAEAEKEKEAQERRKSLMFDFSKASWSY